MNALQKHDQGRVQAGARLIGVDEAGRGCLAGAVVAGACCLSARFFECAEAVELSAEINDSKQLSAAAREAQFAILEQLQRDGQIIYATGLGSVAEIAEFNILGATRLAMRRALDSVAASEDSLSLPNAHQDEPLFQSLSQPEPVKILVDGRPLKPFPYAHEGLVKGDGISLCIAMASIAAKVTRDRMMAALDQRYPAYDFATNKGYGTAKHRAAILSAGASPEHRELFLRKITGA